MKKTLIRTGIAVLALCCTLLSACSQNGTESAVKTAETIPEQTTQTEVEATTAQTTAAPETTAPVQTEEKIMGESLIREEIIYSQAIANNIIGDNNERSVFVYLPPSYTDSGKPMPVIYFLHGYGDNAKMMIDRAKRELDEEFTGDKNEFIFVVFTGNNITGGSFYVNSSASGNWEDFVTDEVVGMIDEKYNTIPDSASRCISGYSMGGYGAINIALKHPDIFGSLITFAPGIYADGSLLEMWESWRNWTDVKRAYAQAFSPNTDPEKYYGNQPEFTGTPEDDAIIAQWDSGYGCWEKKIDEYIARGITLKGIEIDYSDADGFGWIPSGCKFFKKILDNKGIDCTQTVFKGGHVVPVYAFRDYYIPFAEKYLAFE